MHRARVLCNKGSLQDEIEFRQVTFKQNGYCDWEIHNVLTVAPLSDDPASVAFLSQPY
jgi:hypothetical protein